MFIGFVFNFISGHFREEYQTPEGEALRQDDQFMYVAAWEYKGDHQWELPLPCLR